MRRHVLPLLILFVMFSAALFALFNSSWFLLQAIPPSVVEYVRPFQLQFLEMGKAQYRLPSTLVLNDVRFSLTRKLTEVDFKVDRITVFDILDVIKKVRKVRGTIEGLTMEAKDIKIQKANLKFSLVLNETKIVKASGLFGGKSIAFDFYHAEDFFGRMNIDGKKIELLDIGAKVYGGDAKGQILIDRGAMRSYVLWLELAKMEPEKLQEINASLFTGVNGKLNGTFRMRNDGTAVEFFTAELFFPKGGEMSSSLVKKIVSRSASLERKGAEALMTKGQESFFFNEGKLYLQNAGPYRVMLGVELKNKDENLNIRAMHDIVAIDGIDEFVLQDIKKDVFTKGE